MDKFKRLRGEFPHATNDQIDLHLRKQVYPYEYMDSWDRFIETSLPPKEAFYNKLCGQALSDEEYAHAQKVWSRFGCKTILDYHHIYTKCMSTLLTPFLSSCNIYLHISMTAPTHPSPHHVTPIFTTFKHHPLPTISIPARFLSFKGMDWSWPVYSKRFGPSA